MTVPDFFCLFLLEKQMYALWLQNVIAFFAIILYSSETLVQKERFDHDVF